MEFHPQKCQILRISNKLNAIKSKYFIHNVELNLTESAKYLGVIIDSKLKWKDQYMAACKKANGVLAFLKRNIWNCPQKVKENCYKSLVMPILDYGSCVWDPHHQVYIEKFEKIHKNAARFVTNNYIMESGNTELNMLKLNWTPLEERRAKAKVTILYKALNGLIEIPVSQLNIKSYSTRSGKHTFTPPVSNVDSHLHSFYPSTIRLWGGVPEAARSAPNLECFKNYSNSYTLRSKY